MSDADHRYGSAAAAERRFALTLLTPSLVLVFISTALPVAYLVWTSLQHEDLSMPYLNGFDGFENFRTMIEDDQFWSALGLSVVYTASTVILQVVIGLTLALAISEIRQGQWITRLVAILPVVFAPVVVGLFFRTLLLTPTFGIFDYFTQLVGLGSHNWLGDPGLALISVIAIHTWQWTPFSFLVFLAALASLPGDIYEAARMDRASAFRRFSGTSHYRCYARRS